VSSSTRFGYTDGTAARLVYGGVNLGKNFDGVTRFPEKRHAPSRRCAWYAGSIAGEKPSST
jgi:hypothetical protein